MGIFSFFRPNKKSSEIYKQKDDEKVIKTETDNFDSNQNKLLKENKILSSLGINLHEFNQDEMEDVEISLQEEIDDVIRVSEIYLQEKEDEFDYISLSEFKNGTKSLYLSQSNQKEKAIKNLIDKFFEKLGETHLMDGEFSKTDLLILNENNSFKLREWYLDNYKITVGYNYNNSDNRVNYVIVDERV
ncbi:hypothetical protein [Mesoflavibacter sp. CH_XMU1404-2]|uniref:hypothetical protein n=1 Tax=Mesoflavibacter sp. CH_XMU1404-2 TaxID=3107766 RepID=UPI003009E5B2|tara:strand:+ start:217 stop:780 length:564 start_codon:yes stop_codon:yes gene_type:complete